MEPSQSEQFTPEESIQRRNEVLRRMLTTPPQQHAKAPPQAAKSRKKADAGDVPPASDKPEKA
jgi:hypothetical protein